MQKIFITRKVPQKGLDTLLNQKGLNVEIWPEPLPPAKRSVTAKSARH